MLGWAEISRLFFFFDLCLRDLDPLMEERPGDPLVAGRRGERAVVAIVAPQILRQQGLDVEGRDVDLLICPPV